MEKKKWLLLHDFVGWWLCALGSHVCCWRVLEQIAELDSSAGATQTTVEAKQDVNLNIPKQLAALFKCFCHVCREINCNSLPT